MIRMSNVDKKKQQKKKKRKFLKLSDEKAL